MALSLSSRELDHHFAALKEIRLTIDAAEEHGASRAEVKALIEQSEPWVVAVEALTDPYTRSVPPPTFNPIPPSER